MCGKLGKMWQIHFPIQYFHWMASFDNILQLANNNCDNIGDVEDNNECDGDKGQNLWNGLQ